MVRAVIARLARPDDPEDPTALGTISLRKHQVVGASRVMQSLLKFRGAMLCDEVGLGKTFTAAAVMRCFSSTAIVAPAALLPMWEKSLRRARICSSLISLEKFSRGVASAASADLVVIDEAHHFRNHRTLRFRNLAKYVSASRVLLLTATPIHNTSRDIDTLLSLFLGSHASSLTPSEFAECVIRRGRSFTGVGGLPRRVYTPAVTVPLPNSIRRAILDLPPPIPPVDGEECATLVQFTLLRQWVSSDAALRSGLEARIGKARAIIAALESGIYPTRSELEAWLTGGADIQLGFPELLASPGGNSDLLSTVRRHEQATSDLYRQLMSDMSADSWRVTFLRGLRRQYANRKILVFTQFASTARHLFSSMRHDPAVAMITAQRCEIVSGAVNRDFIISRFAPHANGAAIPSARETIDFLIATDLCSEGLNLQDASVLVHLDTPWTPARVEQRVGRIARPGGQHREIFIHTISAPGVDGDVLRLAARLQEKSRVASEIVGDGCRMGHDDLSVPEARERVHKLLEEWEIDFPAPPNRTGCLVAEVSSRFDCFVGLVGNGVNQLLIGGSCDQISDDPRMILDNLGALSTNDVEFDVRIASEIEMQISQWIRQRDLEHSLGVRRPARTSRRRVVKRMETMSSRLPTHLQAAALLLADDVRHAIALDYNAGGEATLEELGDLEVQGEQWVAQVIAAARKSGHEKAGTKGGSGFTLRGLLIGRAS